MWVAENAAPPQAPRPPHAVARLRTARLARSAKPFLARGGPRGERCPGCRLVPSHCVCSLHPVVPTRAGVCLLMADIEPLKPSNTGWLIADVVPDTFAFGWARTEVDPALLALLADPQWQPVVVFPGEFVALEVEIGHAAIADAGQHLGGERLQLGQAQVLAVGAAADMRRIVAQLAPAAAGTHREIA